MSPNHDDRVDDSDQEERIEKLKEQVWEASGGTMTAWTSDALSADEREQFWRRVMDFEKAPLMTDFQRLAEAGMEIPAPDTMNDDQLTAKLWEVIHGLARIRVFLNETDHLSDRELYTVLWRRVLRGENPVLPDDRDSAWHVDLLSSGEETDTHMYLKYITRPPRSAFCDVGCDITDLSCDAAAFCGRRRRRDGSWRGSRWRRDQVFAPHTSDFRSVPTRVVL